MNSYLVNMVKLTPASSRTGVQCGQLTLYNLHSELSKIQFYIFTPAPACRPGPCVNVPSLKNDFNIR